MAEERWYPVSAVHELHGFVFRGDVLELLEK